MHRTSLIIALTFSLLSCSESKNHEANVIPNRRVENTQPVDSTPVPEPQTKKQQSLVQIDRPDSLLFIKRLSGLDTNVYFSDFSPFEEELAAEKLPVAREGDLFVIRHPAYEYKLREVEFDASMAEVQYDEDGEFVVSINDNNFYGSDGELPRTSFSRFTFTPTGGDLVIVNPKFYEDLYNPRFKRGNPIAYKLPNGGCLIEIRGSDGAGGYTALFLMNPNGEVVKRRILMP